jgi:hypothetical protein
VGRGFERQTHGLEISYATLILKRSSNLAGLNGNKTGKIRKPSATKDPIDQRSLPCFRKSSPAVTAGPRLARRSNSHSIPNAENHCKDNFRDAHKTPRDTGNHIRS